MEIYGLESVEPELKNKEFVFKGIANDQAVVFFSSTLKHRDVKLEGLSYENDDGNALAVTVFPRRMEVRSHRSFEPTRVRTIFRELLRDPQMAWGADHSVSYQGRDLIQGDP